MDVCESHGRLRCGECAYIEELEGYINELRNVIEWLEVRFEKEWTYELGTGEAVEEILQKLKAIIN